MKGKWALADKSKVLVELGVELDEKLDPDRGVVRESAIHIRNRLGAKANSESHVSATFGKAKLGTQFCTNLVPRPRLGWIFAVGFKSAAKLFPLRVGDYDVICRRERLCPEPSNVGELLRRGEVLETRWWDG